MRRDFIKNSDMPENFKRHVSENFEGKKYGRPIGKAEFIEVLDELYLDVWHDSKPLWSAKTLKGEKIYIVELLEV